MRKYGKVNWRNVILSTGSDPSTLETVGGLLFALVVLAVCAWGPCG